MQISQDHFDAANLIKESLKIGYKNLNFRQKQEREKARLFLENDFVSQLLKGQAWKKGSRAYTDLEIRRGSVSTSYPRKGDLPPYYDHCSGYRIGRRPVVTISQPYEHVREPEREKMRKWAEEKGLIFLAPDFPSWHYPGWTRLYVFMSSSI